MSVSQHKLFILVPILAATCLVSVLPGCVSILEKLPHKKWGFIDKSGRTVIAPQFDDVARDQYGGCTLRRKPFRNFSSGLCAVRVGNKWGYIDKTGSFKILPKYDSAGNFSDGLAYVRLGTKCGYLDKAGSEAVPIHFDLPTHVAAAFNANPDWDFSQSMIEQFEFSEGLAVAFKGTKAGYIDKTGGFLIEPTFYRAEPFVDGLAAVQLSDGAAVVSNAYIDKTGKVVVNPGQHCIDYSARVFLASNGKNGRERRLCFLDYSGKPLFRSEFEDARIFSEGLAAVAPHFDSSDQSQAYGYVDSSGKLVIAPHFDISGNNLAGNFRHGRAVVSMQETDALGNNHSLHGVIDKSGRWVVQPKYDHISAYCDGLARVLEDSKCIYLDMDGKVVVRTNTFGNSFSEGLAAVMEQ
jgi:hypothetical protein